MQIVKNKTNGYFDCFISNVNYYCYIHIRCFANH